MCIGRFVLETSGADEVVAKVMIYPQPKAVCALEHLPKPDLLHWELFLGYGSRSENRRDDESCFLGQQRGFSIVLHRSD